MSTGIFLRPRVRKETPSQNGWSRTTVSSAEINLVWQKIAGWAATIACGGCLDVVVALMGNFTFRHSRRNLRRVR